LVTDALAALRGPDPGPALAALAVVLERRGERDARELLEAWLRRRR
jgi:hypothetical protein